ncbi:hypothetical protein [Rhodoblastus sp.]|uniref:hypothetical protein n=1 Tax=Rhodoblastus sp. TaxID=1962975 RepID=UPI0035ADD6E3
MATASSNNPFADMLHRPDRMNDPGDADVHIETAARLSRALWIALKNADFDFSEERDRAAMIELASMVADHTSAAQLAFYRKGHANARDKP